MFVPRDLQTAARAVAVLLTVALTPAVALAQSDPLALLERHRTEGRDRRLRREE